MGKIRDFIIACKLVHKIRKERDLLKNLEYYRKSFGNQSIMDKQLLFLSYYNKKTVNSVAKKLGCKYTLYHLNRNSSIIKFYE